MLNAGTVLVWAWILWLASWLLASTWQAEATSRPKTRREIVYRLLTTGGGLFLCGGAERLTHGGYILWRPPVMLTWGVLPVVAAGFAFTWWARLHIGRLWSSGVTRKADHHVVDTGPYRLVRHPIYSGVILAALATAAARGTVDACVGAALLVAGFYIKARLEEEFLRGELGPAYDDYARRVGMLVPFPPGRSTS